MKTAAEKAKRTLMFNFNNRARPESYAMMEHITQGAVGRINSCQAKWIRRTGIPGFGGWFTNKALSGGGDVGDHDASAISWGPRGLRWRSAKCDTFTRCRTSASSAGVAVFFYQFARSRGSSCPSASCPVDASLRPEPPALATTQGQP